MKSVETFVKEFENNIDENKLYTTAETAKILGISREGVIKWIRTKNIDFIKIGNHYRILGSDILKKITYYSSNNK
jgi:excisionase family DNA binding protein